MLNVTRKPDERIQIGDDIWIGFNRLNANRNWEAYIWVNNKKRGLGNYPTEEEAARAYNAAAIVEYGDFARLNFIPGLTYEESIDPPVRNMRRGRPPGVRARLSSDGVST